MIASIPLPPAFIVYLLVMIGIGFWTWRTRWQWIVAVGLVGSPPPASVRGIFGAVYADLRGNGY